MKNFKQFLKENYDFSSVQVKLPTDVSELVRAFGNEIPDNELAPDGRDDRPHITVKYGLHSSSVDALDGINLPDKITAVMGKTSLFENDEDVLKVDIISPDLVDLNELITNGTKTTQTQNAYHSHATIAYLLKGEGKKYARHDRFEGIELEFNDIEFSSKDDHDYISIILGK
jgi:2'-5' RNA ligase